MDKKALFTETLTSLVEFAAAKGNEITQEDVILYFKDFIEDESQYQFIYDYLAINKIKVQGMKFSEKNISDSDSTENQKPQAPDTMESEEELAFIDMYMEELNAIPPASEEEKSQLISQLIAGDIDVVNRLVECHLMDVAQLALEYRGQGVTVGDLIQEGNMALMLGLSDYNSQTEDFDKFIKNTIIRAFNDAINIQVNSNRIGQHLADKLNQLDATTKTLNEKLGRVPEVKELAEEMGFSEDEVSHLLKTSLDTLSINDDTNIASETEATTAPEKDPLEWRINK